MGDTDAANDGPSDEACDDRIHRFTSGKRIAVALPVIEAELSTLWRRVAEEAAAGDVKRVVTRACLWNLIVRVPDADRLAHARAVVDAVSSALPARVLMLDTRAGAPSQPVAASIEVNWSAIDGGSTLVGSDEVTLSAAGDAIDDLASVVRALTVPDVSTAALWLGGVPDRSGALDHEMLAAADRLVFDTDGADGGEAGTLCASLTARAVAAGATRDARSNHVATDLAWLRGAGARTLLASLFDPPASPGAVDALALDDIGISCRRDRVGTALLVAGWLASRLHFHEGRTAPSDGGATIEYRRDDGGTVRVRIAIDREAAEPLGGVELSCEAGRYALHFQPKAAISETPALAWKEPFTPLDEGEHWVAALGPRGRDRLYLAALDELARLAG